MKRSQLNAISRYYTEQRRKDNLEMLKELGKSIEDFNASGYKSLSAYVKYIANPYIAIITSDFGTREYETYEKNAYKVAKELGRAEDTILIKDGEKVIDEVVWNAEKKKYYRVNH